MNTAYGVRTDLPNMCSTRVLNPSNMRATNRGGGSSDIRSKKAPHTDTEDLMSAAVAWDVSAAPALVPVGPRRPHLVVVPGGDHVAAARPGQPLRLTRAGRLTLTLAGLALLVVVALALLPRPSSAAVIDHSLT